MAEKANIYDIAAAAGVSIATVSRVLSGGANVSAKTRERVVRVMEELHYTPNAFARGLGLGTMRMVGVACTDVADAFYARAVSAVERLLRQDGFDVLLFCTGDALEDKRKGLRLMLEKHVDAAVLIGSAFREQSGNSHIEQVASQVPVVVINGFIECRNTYCVLCDEQAAAYEAASALARCCGGPLLYLYDTLTYSGACKLAGFRRALREAGFEEPLAVRCVKALGAARQAVDGLLDAGAAFSGVLASEDLLAVGAQQALRARGVTAPVVGFNNSVLAECATPALSSVDNMLESLCTAACLILRDVLDGRSAAQKVLVSGRLVERESFKSHNNLEE